MKIWHLIVYAGLLAGRIGAAESASYRILPAGQSVMELTVEKTGFLSGKKHVFTFSRYGGTLQFDRERPELSTIAISIESGSISCHDSWLSRKDLASVMNYALKDMLAASRYPAISFRSTAIRKIDADRFEIEGTLQIRDVAKPAVVTVSLRSGPPAELLIEGTSRVRLTDFGLKPPTAALGTIGTRNEMLFHFILVPAPDVNQAFSPGSYFSSRYSSSPNAKIVWPAAMATCCLPPLR